MLDGTHYFECACGSAEHTIRFTLDKQDEPPMIFGDIYLDHYLSWYKRVWVAFKYIFKLPPQNCHFDDWIMRDEDVARLKAMCEDFMTYESPLQCNVSQFPEVINELDKCK